MSQAIANYPQQSFSMIHYIRSHILPLKPVQLLIRVGMKWQQDDCSGMGAALSYYALFSLFPLFLVTLSIIGSLVGPNTEAFQHIGDVVERFLPPEVHTIVKDTVIALNKSSTGAGIIGTLLLIYSASTVFAVLNYSVDRIWRSNDETTEARTIIRSVLAYIVNKLFAFLLVLSTALLLLISLISNIVIQTLIKLLATFEETFSMVQIDEVQLAESLQFGSSFFILALVALILFKILPSKHVAWGDIWLGALITAALVVGLQHLVSTSIISIGGKYLSYGVIGGVMILLLWIYLTCQIFFIGCEFSYVYSHMFGSRRDR